MHCRRLQGARPPPPAAPCHSTLPRPFLPPLPHSPHLADGQHDGHQDEGHNRQPPAGAKHESEHHGGLRSGISKVRAPCAAVSRGAAAEEGSGAARRRRRRSAGRAVAARRRGCGARQRPCWVGRRSWCREARMCGAHRVQARTWVALRMNTLMFRDSESLTVVVSADRRLVISPAFGVEEVRRSVRERQ